LSIYLIRGKTYADTLTGGKVEWNAFNNYCADFENNGVITDIAPEKKSHASLQACKQDCASRIDCAAVEWYEKAEYGKYERCFLANQADQVAFGVRYMDAQCHIKKIPG
jgi:hypothetical protein